MKKGKIIVIEGVDGAGKTTQVNLLKEKLDLNKNIFLREPGGTKAGQDIRKTILNYNLDTKTELLLFYASRNELILNEILPAVNSGKNVILDRFELSSYAYQIYGRERPDLKNFIDELSKNIVPENFIDKYYFLDLDVSIAKKRESERDEESTRFDAEGTKFFNKIRIGYKETLKKFSHRIIDASKSLNDVTEDFITDVVEFLEK